MNLRILPALAVLLLVAVPAGAQTTATTEHHRATHLGNLSTRFAPPLVGPEDMRARFRDPRLQPDIGEILRQWGWPGDLADLFHAALTNEIAAVEIPVGATMPFMSSREGGEPICLRNVTWAGRQPIAAYAFYFVSRGERYRCVMPKPCSNFFVEDLGPEPKPVLALDCSAPEKVPLGRPAKVCLTLHNLGNAAESNATVMLVVPGGATAGNITAGGVVNAGSIRWQVSDLAPAASRQFCATFTSQEIGSLEFASTAGGVAADPVQSDCSTRIFGIAAILLEKADDPDPVAVGDTTTYTVKVTNQGTADDDNVQVTVDLAPELVPVSSAEGKIDGQTVTLPLIPKLAAKDAVSYQIVARGVKAGDGHTKFTLASDALTSPIHAEESTTVY
jgi:uncharacterized repeat protein (TIGR01451 family)